ncbi:ATP-binding protein [Actinoplanes solisilvae]|uniref:ATP-binding protein n=1 Tax=Actinoplanes solisilvae TaxID=2486853 RepID=UPI000FDA86CD|nr:LuxR family transcriptional regulator [Actinoplanes solisilvae]
MALQVRGGLPELRGRDEECAALDELLSDGSAGHSRVIVLRGDAGVGKSALLRHVRDRSDEWCVAEAAGVESEMELAYSGLFQLCSPLLAHAGRLPAPQGEALATVFGRSSGPPPDRFLVGLATLSLLAEVAERQPLVCLIDDAQWLDEASAQILSFVCRRLFAERVAIVCAARTGSGVLAGLPELPIGGLLDEDARALLLAHVHGPLDVTIRDQIVGESHGNPLALIELPRNRTPLDLAGGFGLPGSHPVAGRLEQGYALRLAMLPPDTRLLVLAAAAEPLGDPVLLRRVARVLGLPMRTINVAVDADLLVVGERVEFTHPLVRSAAYHSATSDDRQSVHSALADATDPEADPDRRAWHRARAASGPDEQVAAELERSADRARNRGGLAAAAAFGQRSVALTEDPARRSARALDAACTTLRAGAFDAALALLATAERGPLTDFQRARAELVRGHVAFASGRGDDAPGLLLAAARGLEPFDVRLARETYLTAWTAAQLSGRGDVIEQIFAAVDALVAPGGTPTALDLFLEGFAVRATKGHRAAAPTLSRAAAALTGITADDIQHWGWAAGAPSAATWDDEGMRTIFARVVELTREAGSLEHLPLHLSSLAVARAWTGDLTGAEALLVESESVAAATGTVAPSPAWLYLRALEGEELPGKTAEGDGIGAAVGHWAAAILCNGLGRYREAAEAAQLATANPLEPWISTYALPELVEGAVRAGDADLAQEALERLIETTEPSGTDFGRGVEARCRGLVGEGPGAEHCYREGIRHLSRTPLVPETARAHLVYGEWLRRERRRVDARRHLRAAHDMLTSIGMTAFAERARRELVATGETLRRRGTEARRELTPQEEQIVRLADDGLTNREIGAKLFLSPRTVEWHLRKAFTKLGIKSRNALHTVLASRDFAGASGPRDR